MWKCVTSLQADRFGYTPLILAVIGGHVEVVHQLLTHGADINKPDLHLNTPLHHACFKQRKKVALLLMEAGTQ